MSEIIDQALARAAFQSANGPQFGEGQCMMRTRILYDAPAIGDYDHDGAADAEDGWKFATFKHPTTNAADIPRGVPVWWGGGSHDNGHVAVSAGNGACWSTDIRRTGFYDFVPIALIHEKWGLPLLGWTEDIDGVRIWTPPAPALATKEDPDMTLLADLKAVAVKHDVSLVYAARILLRQAAANAKAHARLARLSRINTARAALKGME